MLSGEGSLPGSIEMEILCSSWTLLERASSQRKGQKLCPLPLVPHVLLWSWWDSATWGGLCNCIPAHRLQLCLRTPRFSPHMKGRSTGPQIPLSPPQGQIPLHTHTHPRITKCFPHSPNTRDSGPGTRPSSVTSSKVTFITDSEFADRPTYKQQL